MNMDMDMTTVDPTAPAPVHYKMWMWFHTEINDTIWFDWWHIVDVPMLIWACLIVFVFGISLELLKFIRYKVQIKLEKAYPSSTDKYLSRTFSIPHLVNTAIFSVQMIWGYMLMLVFMTFSVYICTSLVAGENEPILFWEWLPADTIGYVFSCIGVALISLAYELFRFLRYKVQNDERDKRRISITESCCCDDNETQPILRKEKSHLSSLYNSHHIADSLLFFIQLYGSYTLMLVWMTYNVPIVISSAIGHIIGYGIFGPLMSFKEEEKIGDCCA